MCFFFATLSTLCHGSEIRVSLKGAASKCFGEELANNELLVLKADVQSPSNGLINLFVLSGIAEVGEVNPRNVDKKNILFQDIRKSQIGTALTSSSVIIYFYAIVFFRLVLTGFA